MEPHEELAVFFFHIVKTFFIFVLNTCYIQILSFFLKYKVISCFYFVMSKTPLSTLNIDFEVHNWTLNIKQIRGLEYWFKIGTKLISGNSKL
jgi:hypothetical protein